MIIYVAGKMTGLPNMGRERFMQAERMLESFGYVVLNPAVLPDGLKFDAYMPICLAMLNAADAIFLMDGWRDSMGATLEHDYALYQGKQVITQETIFDFVKEAKRHEV